MTASLKAYSVLEDDENTGGIVFAKSGAEARRIGSNQFGDGDFNWGKARRARWADEFVPGPVPIKAQIEHGWKYECHGCYVVIDDSQYGGENDEIKFDIVEVEGAVYCTPECRDDHLAQRAEVKRIEQFVIGDLTDRLLRLLPGATIAGRTHVYMPNTQWPMAAREASIEFTFPGARIGFGSFRFREIGETPHVEICAGDRIAYYRWREAGYPPHMMDATEVA